MYVKDLIELLSTFPENALVLIPNKYIGYGAINNAYMIYDTYLPEGSSKKDALVLE